MLIGKAELISVVTVPVAILLDAIINFNVTQKLRSNQYLEFSGSKTFPKPFNIGFCEPKGSLKYYLKQTGRLYRNVTASSQQTDIELFLLHFINGVE